MAFMLGSFSDGMFSAAKSVASIYGMYQGIQQTQSQLDAASAVGDAAEADRRDQSISEAVDRQRQAIGDTSGSGYTPIDTTEGGASGSESENPGPVADVNKVTRQPNSLRGAMAPEVRNRVEALVSGSSPTEIPSGGEAYSPQPAPAPRVPTEIPSGGEAYSPQSVPGAAAPLPVVRPIVTVDPTQAGTPLAQGVLPQQAIPAGHAVSPTQLPTYDTPPGGYQPSAAPSTTPAGAEPYRPGEPPPATTSAIPAMGTRGLQPWGYLQPRGAAVPATPATAQPPSLGSRILGAINPVGSAQAAPAPQGAALPLAQADTASAPPAPAASAPAPAAPQQALQTSTPAAPSSSPQAAQQPAQQAQPGPVPVQGGQAKVAPNQTGPTLQSETTPTVVKPAFDPRPYAALAEQAPKYRAVIDKVATEEGVSPERLALHWNLENNLSTDWKTGANGEQGMMQMLPSTRDFIDPKHTLDPSKPEDSLRLAARYINTTDSEFGKDSPSSVAAYQGGPGSADAIARDPAGAWQAHPRTMSYVSRAFPETKLGAAHFVQGVRPDAQGLVNAGSQGPEQFIRYMAQTGPRGMQMTDLWRRAETSLMVAAASRGDLAGMQHARDFVLQMSQQGTSANLMAAHQALLAGDGTSAAQYLAKAHAFFPDGTIGRFGVDKSGAVWGQRVDEHDPSKVLGPHFKVTPDELAPMLIQTRDPEKYLQLVTQQQQAASQMRFQAAHGAYYGGLLETRNQGLQLQAQAHQDATAQRADAAAQRAETARYAAEQHRAGQENAAAIRAGANTSVQAALSRSVDKESASLFNETTMPDTAPGDRGVAAQVYADLRMNAPTGTMPPPHAQAIAQGLIKGQYQVKPTPDGHFAAVDPKSPQVPLAYLSPAIGARLAGASAAAPRQAIPTSPVGAGAGTPYAAGMTSNLAGTSASSAVPPGTTVH